MLNFQQLLLRKLLPIFSILFIALGFVIYFWIKEFHLEQTKETLVNNIKILALDIPHCTNLDKLAQDVKNDLGLRLTLIDMQGNIVAESHKDKSKMQNHKHREEIVESNTKPYGFIIRHSDTLNKDFLYVAKCYVDYKKPLYIRLSREIQSINNDIFSLGVDILVVLLFFFGVLFFLTYKISTKIEHEVEKIANFLTSLTKKNKNTYITSTLSIEFHKITSLLTKVSKILAKKEKQKSKFTAKLQSSNKQKEDIISAISHEFKNPIAVINGYSQTLMDDTNINASIRQKFLTKIYNNGVKLSELIDTLRLSSKLDSGQQETHFKNINLYNLVHDTVENIELHYPKRQVTIQGGKGIEIKGDSSLFGVVVTNLVENAFKYSEDEVKIVFDQAELSVIDTGIGISTKNLEKITNKFYRVNENSWNNSLGLGLFIVSNILDLHNFSLEIKSV